MAALASNALTTEQRVIDALGTTSRDTASLINTASDFIERQTNRKYGRADLVELHSGFGTTRLVVERPPIITTTPVTIKFKASLTDSGSVVDSDNFVVDDADAGTIQRVGGWRWTAHNVPDISQGLLVGTEIEKFEVTYRGGFQLPKDATPADPQTLPFDLEEACIRLVSQYLRARDRDPSVKSEALMSYSVTYRDDDSDPFIDTVLKSYTLYM